MYISGILGFVWDVDCDFEFIFYCCDGLFVGGVYYFMFVVFIGSMGVIVKVILCFDFVFRLV